MKLKKIFFAEAKDQPQMRASFHLIADNFKKILYDLYKFNLEQVAKISSIEGYDAQGIYNKLAPYLSGVRLALLSYKEILEELSKDPRSLKAWAYLRNFTNKNYGI